MSAQNLMAIHPIDAEIRIRSGHSGSKSWTDRLTPWQLECDMSNWQNKTKKKKKRLEMSFNKLYSNKESHVTTPC